MHYILWRFGISVNRSSRSFLKISSIATIEGYSCLVETSVTSVVQRSKERTVPRSGTHQATRSPKGYRSSAIWSRILPWTEILQELAARGFENQISLDWRQPFPLRNDFVYFSCSVGGHLRGICSERDTERGDSASPAKGRTIRQSSNSLSISSFVAFGRWIPCAIQGEREFCLVIYYAYDCAWANQS